MATNLSSNITYVWCPYVSIQVMAQVWLLLYLLYMPLFLCVLYEGCRRMKARQPPPSHCDVFTFNIVAMEILVMIGSCIFMIGDKNENHIAIWLGGDLYSIGERGQICVHSLTCVERYLAVVHPITYLRLKKRGGVAIRNMSIIGTWLFSIGLRNIRHDLKDDVMLKLHFFFTVLPVAVVSFCSGSVLLVLIRPKPGERGVRRVDPLKHKAFVTIIVIMGVLLLRFVYYTVIFSLSVLQILKGYKRCVALYSAPFFNFPSSLVLPLMFLQRAKKLPMCFVKN